MPDLSWGGLAWRLVCFSHLSRRRPVGPDSGGLCRVWVTRMVGVNLHPNSEQGRQPPFLASRSFVQSPKRLPGPAAWTWSPHPELLPYHFCRETKGDKSWDLGSSFPGTPGPCVSSSLSQRPKPRRPCLCPTLPEPDKHEWDGEEDGEGRGALTSSAAASRSLRPAQAGPPGGTARPVQSGCFQELPGNHPRESWFLHMENGGVRESTPP